ncbi:hypothetical protein HAX54_048249 [Datura stramonium]|uniref:Uncharacterized protein n=1 Tax=Datura stramonium TaxID=4076 RepID=A0ABS8WMW5_DATST|nr:hypothetical protein [Datura stramonium]
MATPAPQNRLVRLLETRLKSGGSIAQRHATGAEVKSGQQPLSVQPGDDMVCIFHRHLLVAKKDKGSEPSLMKKYPLQLQTTRQCDDSSEDEDDSEMGEKHMPKWNVRLRKYLSDLGHWVKKGGSEDQSDESDEETQRSLKGVKVHVATPPLKTGWTFGSENALESHSKAKLWRWKVNRKHQLVARRLRGRLKIFCT